MRQNDSGSAYRTIQNSKESLKKLAQEYGINPKTVAKWKKRDMAQDAAIGPKNPHSTTLTLEEEAGLTHLKFN